MGNSDRDFCYAVDNCKTRQQCHTLTAAHGSVLYRKQNAMNVSIVVNVPILIAVRDSAKATSTRFPLIFLICRDYVIVLALRDQP